MNNEEKDERYMRRCLQLAANGMQNARPNPMVGAVIVSGDRIIGEGYHQRYGEGHAEVNAFASVRAADEPLLAESTIYVSLEPCSHYGKTPPCADLIIRKGVKRCVVGCVDPFAEVSGRGIQRLRDAGITVITGVLEQECRWLNRRFFTYHSKHRPYIILKWAQSADGFIDKDYKAIQLSNSQTQIRSHKLRADEDAILVGHTTYEREHPLLNVRYWSGPDPKRIVLTHDRPLPLLIDDLYMQGIQSLIVEGGSQTHQSFIESGLWDELRVETAPMVLGRGTKAVSIPANARLLRQETYDGNTLTTYLYQ
ncbi:MAG: bifunctional diaminohydroxyphosphoribosylaminopyrimidine deaminase/5-amino-6-(5-phosphoribosylamino)uracil reductase RibD [Prevotella sp.]|nr:bifunctional diaminohydroxyphosphoribosylaminopyrimidine deaminase/5-amino-6-(5-phosphoribosylamino)uracil reductase RibD [Prevotella sp.]